MNRSQILEKITPLIADKLNVTEDKITESSNFENDLGADSLDKIELVMELEDEFSIEIADEDADWLKTVGDVLNILEHKTIS